LTQPESTQDVSRTSPSIREARAQQRDLWQVDAPFRSTRLPRLLALPFVAWVLPLPLDLLRAADVYGSAAHLALLTRGAGAVALALIWLFGRRAQLARPHHAEWLIGLVMTSMAAPLGVLAGLAGTLSLTPWMGAGLVMSAPAFVYQPWRRTIRPVLVSLGAFLLGVPVSRALTGAPVGELAPIVFGASMLALAASLAVAGGHFNHALRQQVLRSQSLGKYELERRIGRGGMGEVWSARHPGLRRSVALKVLRDVDAPARARFEREVAVLSELRHPNTVRILDFGATETGAAFFAMELLVGPTLAEVVADQGPLAPARVVHIGKQIARALGEAHAKGMAHRDVKPANLILAEAGGEPDFVKIIDFGIVRLETDVGRASRVDELVGTPKYMAPEVVAGASAGDARSDVYALGAVMFFLLVGTPPFVADSTAGVLVAHLKQTVPMPSRRIGTLPAALEALLMRCLSKNPADRPQDGLEFARALEALDPASLRDTSPPKTQRSGGAPPPNDDPTERMPR
jgi:eukaryotic-like serine/threonine-protein kinase